MNTMRTVSFFHLITLWLVARLFTCQPLPSFVAYGTLNCSQQYEAYSFPVRAGSYGYQIRMQIMSNDTLPSALAIFNKLTDISKFDKYSLYSNNNVDISAIQSNKKIQKLYYFPTISSQSQFIFSIFRLSLQKMSFITNLDRTIQNFDGSNIGQLYKCTAPINYVITIRQISSPIAQSNEIAQPPLYSNECLSGSFNAQSSTCACAPNFGMPLCDTQFYQITDFGIISRKYLQQNQKHYYYFVPTLQQFNSKSSLTISMTIKGDQSQKYIYNSGNSGSQFAILWSTQSKQGRLSISSYFNQMNPSSLAAISIKPGERLVITVYKPKWATQQYYEISIANQDAALQQFVVILICVSVSVTVLSIILFIFWLIYRKKRNQEAMLEGMGIAFPVRRGLSFNANKIFNYYFPVNNFFPDITFKQLRDGLMSGQDQNGALSQELMEKSTCSICLDQFEKQTLVKSTYCLHIFHSKCLSQWMARQPSCPLCRHQYSIDIVSKLNQKLQISGNNLSALDRYLKIWESKKSKPCKQQIRQQDIKVSPEKQIQSSHHIKVNNQEISN